MIKKEIQNLEKGNNDLESNNNDSSELKKITLNIRNEFSTMTRRNSQGTQEYFISDNLH